MRRLIASVALAAAALGTGLAGTASASSTSGWTPLSGHWNAGHSALLVKNPAGSVCTGSTFTTGLWDPPDALPAPFTFSVYGPSGAKVFHWAGNVATPGHAPRLQWDVRTSQAGTYRAVYRVAGVTATLTYTTYAHYC